MRYRQVVVIGSGDEDKFATEAYEVGRHIAKKGWALISGGKGGVMEAASRGASEAGGIVIGILPEHTANNANKFCNIVIPTGMGYARNLINVLSGDVIISIAGKSGTLSELAYAWQFGKPVILCGFTGGWSEKFSRSPVDDRTVNKFYVAESIEKVFDHLEKLLA